MSNSYQTGQDASRAQGCLLWAQLLLPLLPLLALAIIMTYVVTQSDKTIIELLRLGIDAFKESPSKVQGEIVNGASGVIAFVAYLSDQTVDRLLSILHALANKAEPIPPQESLKIPRNIPAGATLGMTFFYGLASIGLVLWLW